MSDPRYLSLCIVECPGGGFVIKDGASPSASDITAKSSLREAQNACADMVGLFFQPPAPADDAGDETFEPPRMMRQESNIVRPSFMRRMMGARS